MQGRGDHRHITEMMILLGSALTLRTRATMSQSPEQMSELSKKASQLKSGMSYQQVVALLGRVPDTIYSDKVREEMGEPIQGNDLITLYWRNDGLNYPPVAVQFEPPDMTVSGWDEGKGWHVEGSVFTQPEGKPFLESEFLGL